MGKKSKTKAAPGVFKPEKKAEGSQVEKLKKKKQKTAEAVSAVVEKKPIKSVKKSPKKDGKTPTKNGDKKRRKSFVLSVYDMAMKGDKTAIDEKTIQNLRDKLKTLEAATNPLSKSARKRLRLMQKAVAAYEGTSAPKATNGQKAKDKKKGKASPKKEKKPAKQESASEEASDDDDDDDSE